LARGVEVTPSRVVAGGDALARDRDGKVMLVEGALPGERVRAQVLAEHRSWSQAVVVDVLEPSDARREPPCRYVAAGCGGCTWQHIEPAAQRLLKRQIVADALRRQGRLRDLADDDPRLIDGPVLDVTGHRTTVRAAVVGKRPGFRRPASHEVLPVDACLVAHPAMADLFDARYPGVDEVTFRVGARTGERLVLAAPSAAGLDLPGDVVVVGADELAEGRRAWFHEEAAGRRWRISAASFFQTRPDGADALVAAVAAAVERWAPAASTLVDLCAGVGLFAGGLATALPDRPWRVIAVEQHAPAVSDARHNLADLDVRVVRAAIDQWHPAPADIVVADPPRTGLGRRAVQAVAGTGAALVVLVSCDPASLGRDTALLGQAGYQHQQTELIELFPQTWHVEAVSSFTAPRGRGAAAS
jgi:23S rRNA (uracil1939-C5)-methyltransferase